MTIAEEFFQYIARRAELPDSEIDHSGWASCAVGEFLRDEHQGYYSKQSAAYTTKKADELLEELERDHYAIYESLNHGGLDEESGYNIDDYAGLRHFVELHRNDPNWDQFERDRIDWG